MSKRTFTQAFKDYADKDETVSAIELTEIINEVAERDLSDKTVRAHLRKIKARDQREMKNAIWRIDKTLAESEVKHFTRKQSEQAS